MMIWILTIGVVAAIAGGAWWWKRRQPVEPSIFDEDWDDDVCLACLAEPGDAADDGFEVDEELLMHLLMDLEDPELAIGDGNDTTIFPGRRNAPA